MLGLGDADNVTSLIGRRTRDRLLKLANMKLKQMEEILVRFGPSAQQRQKSEYGVLSTADSTPGAQTLTSFAVSKNPDAVAQTRSDGGSNGQNLSGI